MEVDVKPNRGPNPVTEYVRINQERLARSRNARRWFYRGIATAVVVGVVAAKLTNDHNEESN